MPERESEIARDQAQHQEKCPSCLGKNTRLVPDANTAGSYFMGCETCGHTWVGRDFQQNEQGEDRPPIPDTDPK